MISTRPPPLISGVPASEIPVAIRALLRHNPHERAVCCGADPGSEDDPLLCVDEKPKAAMVKALNLGKNGVFICGDAALTDEEAANLALQRSVKTI